MRLVNPYIAFPPAGGGAFPSPWENWDAYTPVTSVAAQVAGSSGTHDNFQWYVDLSRMPSTFWSKSRSDLGDVRAANGSGTELPLDIAVFDDGAETGYAVVEYDGLNKPTTTELRLYYGNAAATTPAVGSTFGRNKVWDRDHLGIAHCEEDPSGAILDSSGDGDFASVGTMTSGDEVAAAWGNGYQLDGIDDGIFKVRSVAPTYPFTI